jgi:uncharacterized membrane protein HdeD (DUF308 family)
MIPIMATIPANSSAPTVLPHLWKATLFSGVLSVILGVLIAAWPGATLLVAAVVFGIYLLISGIAQVIFAFTLHIAAGGRVLLFISGAASLVLAILAFRHFGEGYAILLLAIWIGVGFIFRGVAHTATALGDPHLPGRGWEIFFGVVSVLAGIVLLAWPDLSLATLVWVSGIWLVVLGIFEIVTAFVIRRESANISRPLTG